MATVMPAETSEAASVATVAACEMDETKKSIFPFFLRSIRPLKAYKIFPQGEMTRQNSLNSQPARVWLYTSRLDFTHSKFNALRKKLYELLRHVLVQNLICVPSALFSNCLLATPNNNSTLQELKGDNHSKIR